MSDLPPLLLGTILGVPVGGLVVRMGLGLAIVVVAAALVTCGGVLVGADAGRARSADLVGLVAIVGDGDADRFGLGRRRGACCMGPVLVLGAAAGGGTILLILFIHNTRNSGLSLACARLGFLVSLPRSARNLFLFFSPLLLNVPFQDSIAQFPFQFQFQNPGYSVRPSPIGPIGYATGVEFVAHLSEVCGFLQVTEIDSPRRLPKTIRFLPTGWLSRKTRSLLVRSRQHTMAAVDLLIMVFVDSNRSADRDRRSSAVSCREQVDVVVGRTVVDSMYIVSAVSAVIVVINAEEECQSGHATQGKVKSSQKLQAFFFPRFGQDQ